MTERLSLSERLDWLQLVRSAGVGPKTFFRLLHRFGSARRAFQELPRISRDAGGAERPRCRRSQAEAELDALQALGCHLVAHGEPDYPPDLAQIHDPPPLLTVRGDLGTLHAPAIAMVGARNASANGRLLAKTIAQDLAVKGLVVVSGLARGIDTAAHKAVLAAGGRTVAVIASGVDVAYPADNADLMETIAETGAVISERPLGSAPQARHFPRRNRLISGLCAGVLVVEAAPNSGSLITARMAAEQGRDVMAVPGSPLDPRHRGTNQLLRDGAALVETVDDVCQALGPGVLAPLSEATRSGTRSTTWRPAAKESVATTATRFDQSPASPLSPTTLAPPSIPAPPSSSAAPVPAPGDHLISEVCERLGTEPLLVDELIRQCHANSAEMQHALLELELEGRIERHPGNRVSLVSR